MKKLFRIIVGGLCIALGLAGIISTVYLFTQGVDIITGIVYIAFIAISASFIGLGWTIISGGNVKELLRDIISGISF